MIAKRAIQDYLARDLHDYTWMKSVSRGQLLDHLEEYQIALKTTPFLHQLVGLAISMEEDSFLFFMDAGTGKTKIILDILTYRNEQAPTQALVLAPSEQVMGAWERNIALHSDLSACILYGSTKDRWEKWDRESDCHVYVCSYAGLQYMVGEMKGGKRKMNARRVADVVERVDMVVYDEIHFCKNRQSLNFTICNEIAKHVECRYGLTGTPFGRNPIDLWAQFYLIDRGETFGPTLGLFREALFVERAGYGGWPEWRLPHRNLGLVRSMMNNKSITYSDQECNDLPECVSIVAPYTMSQVQQQYYHNILTEIINSKGDTEQVSNGFVRLRQISSGFIGVRGEEERIEIDLPDNPKIDLLASQLEEFPETDKVVICCDFIHSMRTVMRYLRQRKGDRKAVELYGGTKNKQIWKEFQTNPNIRYLVMVTASGGTGIDLFAANRQIFYESPLSQTVRRQAEKRCHRTGQTKHVYLYDYVGSPVERRILEFVKEGKDLRKSLLGGDVDIQNLLGIDG